MSDYHRHYNREALDRHITGNYGEDQLREESGRPPIDAPRPDHRRWFNEKLTELSNLVEQVSWAEECGSPLTPALRDEVEKVRQELANAYMEGNNAERMTLEFKSNEFDVVDEDCEYIVEIEEYAYRVMKDPPRYKVIIHHDGKPVLKLRNLVPESFNIDSRTIRNINSEGI